MADALVLRDVHAAYDRTPVLQGIDLAVPAGAVLSVVGPSGSGKTTLLRCVGGFEVPKAGEISIAGEVVAGSSWVPAHRRPIGFVSQDGALFPHLSVGDNVGFGLPRAERTAGRIASLLQTVNLSPDLAGRRPDQLSGGQQQRVSLARALARRPAVMLLDEPFSALDTHLRESTRDLVGEVLRRAGVTTILVTHDQQEALAFSDLVAVLDEGRLRQVGPPAEVYGAPADLATARLLGATVELKATVTAGVADTILGDVPAPGLPDGPATAVVRPHQVVAAPHPEGMWMVASVAFHGARRRVDLRRAGDHDDTTLRITTDQPLSPGERVNLAVTGPTLTVPHATS